MAEIATEDKVNAESSAYKSMAEAWDLLHALLGGTREMRRQATKYLPKEPKEDDDDYTIRLARSFLYNAYRDTVKKISSKPFARPVSENGTPPGIWEEIRDNVDKQGTDVTQFAAALMKAACTYGLTHVLVDFPAIPEGSTLDDERKAGSRPIFIHVTPPQLLGWRTEYVAGKPTISEARIFETRVEKKGTYLDQSVNYVRVYTAQTWELHRQDPDSHEWKEESKGTHTFGSVPLVTFYVTKTGFLTGEPPLEDLAHLNAAHWQSSSDQRHILRFVRFGLIFQKGISPEEIDAGLTIGPNRAIRTTSKDADMKYVEHTGKGVDAGQKDLDALQDQMEILGLEPLVRKSGSATATGKAIDEARAQTDIQAWIRSEELALELCVTYAAKWSGEEVADDFAVNIFNEFGLSIRAVEDVKALIDARKNGEISRETFLNEIKRRGLLADTVDVEEELERVENEGGRTDLAGMPGMGGGDEGDDDDDFGGDDEDEED